MQLFEAATLDRKSGEADGPAVGLNPKRMLRVTFGLAKRSIRTKSLLDRCASLPKSLAVANQQDISSQAGTVCVTSASSSSRLLKGSMRTRAGPLGFTDVKAESCGFERLHVALFER